MRDMDNTPIRSSRVTRKFAPDVAKRFACQRKSMTNGITGSIISCAGSVNKKVKLMLALFQICAILFSL